MNKLFKTLFHPFIKNPDFFFSNYLPKPFLYYEISLIIMVFKLIHSLVLYKSFKKIKKPNIGIRMSDDELEKIRQKKAEMLLKLQSIPKEIVSIKNEEDLKRLSYDFNEKIIVIDFWAVWCGPCKIFAPIFKKIQQEYYKDFIFVKIDTDENPLIAQQFGITAIPTTIFLKGGQVLKRQPGAINYNSLKQILEKFKAEN